MNLKPKKTVQPDFIPRIRNAGQFSWRFYQVDQFLVMNDGFSWKIYSYITKARPEWASTCYDRRKDAIEAIANHLVKTHD